MLKQVWIQPILYWKVKASVQNYVANIKFEPEVTFTADKPFYIVTASKNSALLSSVSRMQ